MTLKGICEGSNCHGRIAVLLFGIVFPLSALWNAMTSDCLPRELILVFISCLGFVTVKFYAEDIWALLGARKNKKSNIYFELFLKGIDAPYCSPYTVFCTTAGHSISAPSYFVTVFSSSVFWDIVCQ